MGAGVRRWCEGCVAESVAQTPGENAFQRGKGENSKSGVIM